MLNVCVKLCEKDIVFLILLRVIQEKINLLTYRLNSVRPKMYVAEVLTPVHQNVTLFGDKAVIKLIKLK